MCSIELTPAFAPKLTHARIADCFYSHCHIPKVVALLRSAGIPKKIRAVTKIGLWAEYGAFLTCLIAQGNSDALLLFSALDIERKLIIISLVGRFSHDCDQILFLVNRLAPDELGTLLRRGLNEMQLCADELLIEVAEELILWLDGVELSSNGDYVPVATLVTKKEIWAEVVAALSTKQIFWFAEGGAKSKVGCTVVSNKLGWACYHYNNAITPLQTSQAGETILEAGQLLGALFQPMVLYAMKATAGGMIDHGMDLNHVELLLACAGITDADQIDAVTKPFRDLLV